MTTFSDRLKEAMYAQNLNYFKELTMYILAGKKKLEETRNGKLAEMKNKAALSGLPEDAQAARDLDEKCSRFEKKLHDLELTRMISIQTAPQIRLVQNNDTVMVEKIQSTIVNTIPLWKSQMVLALGLEHSRQATAAQNAVTAAWSLGIGSCYIGDILEQVETHRTLLRLPEYVVPAALLVFGYPTQQQHEREKPRRRALEHIVHENAYRRMEPAELEAMLAANAGARPYGAWLDAFCKRKYNSDFSREMSRSMAEYLKPFLP